MFKDARASQRRVNSRSAVAAMLAGVVCSVLLSAPMDAHGASISENPLAGLAGFTVVSTGDITLGNHELEGSVAAGGDVRVGSASPYSVIHSAAGNGNYSLPRAADGTYFRLIAGGTFDAAGSTSLLRVSSGGNSGTATTEGRVALGETTGLVVTPRGRGVCVQPATVSDCSGATLEQTNFEQSIADVTRPGVFDEFIDEAARDSLVVWSDQIASGGILNTVAVTLAPSGSEYALELTAGKVNVWTVNASDLPSGDWKLAFGAVTPAADTPLVIRVIAADGAVVNLPVETLGFQDAPGGATNNRYARHMLWNIQQSAGQSVTVTSNGIVPGSFLAPRSALTTGPGKTLIEGQIHAAEVTLHNDGEIHHYAFASQLSVEGTTPPSVGGFSVSKFLSGPQGFVPADAAFTVEYSVDGAPAQQLTVRADGTEVTVGALPAGAEVTFVETTKPALAGVIWGQATFSTPTLTIVGGATSTVALTNVFTVATASPVLSSQAYAGDVANGTVTSSTTPVIDEVSYANVIAGAQYSLRGELVHVEDGVIRSTGITNTVPFDAPASVTGTTSGSVESTFVLSPEQVVTLAGTKLLIVEALYDSAGERVAFEGATSATDPWVASTAQWVRVAAGAHDIPATDSAPRLAMTGATVSPGVSAAVAALLFGLICVVGAASTRRARTTVRARTTSRQ
jgi:choice-of-anchor A domain-containing protein